ncbi:MAG: ChbG/HpnK family deacetylase [Blastocatellia bacterium]|nr:ChbG/HpnK family deacetylase [Blastocatellia bacterium]
MKKYLIVNADDYGYSVGVNAGIIEGHQHGIITSATMMATGRAFADGVERLKEVPLLSVGCHMMLVDGEPAARPSHIRSLLSGNDSFPSTLSLLMARLSAGKVKREELVLEFRIQMQKLFNANIVPTHLDSHKHSHIHPLVLDVMIQIAEEYRIGCIRNPFESFPLKKLLWNGSIKTCKRYLVTQLLGYYKLRFGQRIRKTNVRFPEHFHGFVETGTLSVGTMSRILSSVKVGVNELMCHPARLDSELLALPTRLKRSREQELAAMTACETLRIIEQQKIELISFRELRFLKL